MRILHLINAVEIGGAQRLLVDLLPRMAQEEDTVELAVYENLENDFTQHLRDAGIRIIVLGEKNYRNPLLVFKLRKLFKHYDLVHVHLFPSSYWASLAARGLKVKLVFTEHSTSNARRDKALFRPIEKFIYARFDKIISISQQTQDALCQWLGCGDKRFVVVNNGIDTHKFISSDPARDGATLIMVARFVAAKDHQTVIRAMKLLPDDVTLDLVGDGPTRLACETLARELGVSKRIRFLGERTDVAELIAASRIGIQSSFWEGFGLTAVEIMASGKPVVATNVEGLRQVVESAGMLFEVGDEKALASQVMRLLSNVAAYQETAKLCKERALRYDISEMVKRYLELYRNL